MSSLRYVPSWLINRTTVSLRLQNSKKCMLHHSGNEGTFIWKKASEREIENYLILKDSNLTPPFKQIKNKAGVFFVVKECSFGVDFLEISYLRRIGTCKEEEWQAFWQATRNALKQLWRCGWCHGNLSAEHVVFLYTEGEWEARFISLEHLQPYTPEGERADLERLLSSLKIHLNTEVDF